MFEGPLQTKSKLSDPSNSHLVSVAFHLHFPEGVTGLAQPYWLKNRKFSLPPLSFSTLAWGDPFQIYRKALWIIKLESSRQSMVKIW